MSLPTDEFARLFMQHQQAMLRYIRSFVPSPHDAEEVLQETAAALWKKAEAYDPERPFLGWALRFALYEVRTFQRKNRARAICLDEDMLDVLAAERKEMSVLLEDRRSALSHCLKNLSAEQQRMIVERYYHKRSVQDMAAASRDSATALYKAFKRLRWKLFVCINRTTEADGVPG
jgi:RNA polymerase sigma-70 factor (ECF subfamily)